MVLVLFILLSALLVFVILLQEPKQSGLGEGLGGAGGGFDFGSRGGVAGGLQRLTIYMGVTWGVLALLLQIIPR
ncbi:MAG: preprotein translocase subunit SecG [Trueperaceae bacterium]|nr:MAG: preprotein translocase subunit SecG [Trueperaceae bacterium]